MLLTGTDLAAPCMVLSRQTLVQGLQLNQAGLQVSKGRVVLDAALTSTALWCLAISASLGHPLFDRLIGALNELPPDDFDTAGLHRICTVRCPAWLALAALFSTLSRQPGQPAHGFGAQTPVPACLCAHGRGKALLQTGTLAPRACHGTPQLHPQAAVQSPLQLQCTDPS